MLGVSALAGVRPHVPTCAHDGRCACQQRVASRRRKYADAVKLSWPAGGGWYLLSWWNGGRLRRECSPSQVRHRRYCAHRHSGSAERAMICAPGCEKAAAGASIWPERGDAPVQRECRRCGQLCQGPSAARAWAVLLDEVLPMTALDIEIAALWAMRQSLEFRSGGWVRAADVHYRPRVGRGMLEVNGCHWHRHGCSRWVRRRLTQGGDARLSAEKAARFGECAIAEHGVEHVLDALPRLASGWPLRASAAEPMRRDDGQ